MPVTSALLSYDEQVGGREKIRSNKKNPQRNGAVCRSQRWIVKMKEGARDGRCWNDLSYQHSGLFDVHRRCVANMVFRKCMFKALPFMHHRLVFAARLLKLAVTRRHLLLHLALFSFRKQSHVLHLPATPVYAHDEAAGGDKHQQTKGDGRYETNGFHDNGYKDNAFFNMNDRAYLKRLCVNFACPPTCPLWL